MRRVSLKRRGEAKARQAALDAVMDRDGDGCYAFIVIVRHWTAGCGWPTTCAGPLDGHEIIPRSRRPGSHLEPDLIRMCCRRHHSWLHDHPVTATTLGLLSPSWESPA